MERKERGRQKMRWKENGAETCDLMKLYVAKDFTDVK